MWWRRLAAPTARTWRAPVRVSSSAARLRDDVFFAPASAVLAPFPRPAPLPPRRPERDLRRRADPCRDAEAALHDGLAAGGDAGRLFADALSAYARGGDGPRAAAALGRWRAGGFADAALERFLFERGVVACARAGDAAGAAGLAAAARGAISDRGHRAAVLCCVRSGDVGAALRAAALKAPESPRGEAQLRRLLRSAMFRPGIRDEVPVLDGFDALGLAADGQMYARAAAGAAAREDWEAVVAVGRRFDGARAAAAARGGAAACLAPRDDGAVGVAAAGALQRLGRWDEALESLEAAAARRRGGDDVLADAARALAAFDGSRAAWRAAYEALVEAARAGAGFAVPRGGDARDARAFADEARALGRDARVSRSGAVVVVAAAAAPPRRAGVARAKAGAAAHAAAARHCLRALEDGDAAAFRRAAACLGAPDARVARAGARALGRRDLAPGPAADMHRALADSGHGSPRGDKRAALALWAAGDRGGAIAAAAGDAAAADALLAAAAAAPGGHAAALDAHERLAAARTPAGTVAVAAALCRAGEVDAAIALAARSVDADGDDAAALLAALRRCAPRRPPGTFGAALAAAGGGADAALDALVDALDAGEALTLGDFDAALDVLEAAGRHADALDVLDVARRHAVDAPGDGAL